MGRITRNVEGFILPLLLTSLSLRHSFTPLGSEPNLYNVACRWVIQKAFFQLQHVAVF